MIWIPDNPNPETSGLFSVQYLNGQDQTSADISIQIENNNLSTKNQKIYHIVQSIEG